MKEIFNFVETGKLMIEKIFFDAGYPILFTVRSESNELYLCVCCRNNKDGKKWLLSETTPEIILQLLRDRITIRDAFLLGKMKRFTITHGAEWKIEADAYQDWDEMNSISLPDSGEYMEAEIGEFAEEIEFYNNIRLINIYKKISQMTFSAVLDLNNDNMQSKGIEVRHDYIMNTNNPEIELQLPNFKDSWTRNNYKNEADYRYAA